MLDRVSDINLLKDNFDFWLSLIYAFVLICYIFSPFNYVFFVVSSFLIHMIINYHWCKANFLASQGLRESSSRALIGVKSMGDLDSKPFLIATKRKFSEEEAQEKALELCSLWDHNIRDSSWHPFKIIMHNEKAKVRKTVFDYDL